MFKKDKIIIYGKMILSSLIAGQVNANKLVCPELTFSHIKNLQDAEDTFKVEGNPGTFFVEKGFKELPNRLFNPITISKGWRPELIRTENKGSAYLSCHYKYKTTKGIHHKFIVSNKVSGEYQRMVHNIDPSLIDPSKTYDEIKAFYKNEFLEIHEQLLEIQNGTRDSSLLNQQTKRINLLTQSMTYIANIFGEKIPQLPNKNKKRSQKK